MGVVAALTADIQDLNVFDNIICRNVSTSVFEISTTQARTGTHSYKLYAVTNLSDTVSIHKNTPERADYYFRICFYFEDLNTERFNIYFREGDRVHVTLVVSASAGTIAAYKSDVGTLLGTSSGVTVVTDQWHCLEGYVKIHDTTGEVTLKLDGTQVLNLTSVDTRNGGTTGLIDNIAIQASYSYGASFYLDDIVIRDDAWPGQGGLYVITPSSDGSVDNWTASAGNQYECVDDNPPNDYTDYISTGITTLNTKQLFGHGGLPDQTYDSIAFAAVLVKAKSTASGDGNIRPIIVNSGNYGNGTTVPLGPVTSRYLFSAFIVNPEGSAAWTEAEINATEFGVETI